MKDYKVINGIWTKRLSVRRKEELNKRFDEMLKARKPQVGIKEISILLAVALPTFITIQMV